jgi:hypothetical protein
VRWRKEGDSHDLDRGHILLILWLVGLVSSYTMGGFIHVLLLAALLVVVFQLFRRRKVTAR